MKMIKNLYVKYREIVNYLIVGVLTTIVSLAIKYALLFTVLNAEDAFQLQIAVISSWTVAVAFAYFTNRIFVFKSKNKDYLKEITTFVSGRVLTLFLDMFIMWFFVTFLKLNTDLWVIVWTLVSQVLITIGNYIISKLFVFKK